MNISKKILPEIGGFFLFKIRMKNYNFTGINLLYVITYVILIREESYGCKEFEKIPQLKYWDRVTDEIKSKRDKALRKAKQRVSKSGKVYYLPSNIWKKLNKALDMAYHRRRVQIKSSMYAISNANM